ncbi:MAG TPA: 30S ribosomal protein S3 [archaeon]|nr:30S ribosomal protein S3 [archaeon]
MAIEKHFIKEGIRLSDIETYLFTKFERAGYSHSEMQRTALGTKIVIYVSRPGMVIGRSGRKIDELAEEIKKKFGIDNPLVDIREVENKFMDANIVARRIADSIEKGINYKKSVNFYIDKVMESGAVGILVIAAGKLIGSERSLTQKFKKGYIIHSGNYSETLMDRGHAKANLKAGIVGIMVKILREAPKEFEFIQEQ